MGRKAISGLSSGRGGLLEGDGGCSGPGDANEPEKGLAPLVPAGFAVVATDRGLQLSGEEEVLGHYNEISRAYPIARRPFGGDTGPCHFHGDTGPCNPSAGGSVQAGRRVNAGS